jgi:mono/diheme cytochrome c family protein
MPALRKFHWLRHPEPNRFSGGAKDLAREEFTAHRARSLAPLAKTQGSGMMPFSIFGGTVPWLRTMSSGLAVLAIIALTSSCRLDMHVQPKENPLSRSDFYADQRSERPPVEGTVARDELRSDNYFYTGKIGSNPGDVMPFAVTKEVLDRGRERFNIYCAPCHSRLGDGNGFVPSRGFARKPPSFHIARLEKAPLGYFFDVMTNGFGIMPDYASQIPPHDRWDIVAYIRALQLSQNANMSDVPAGQQIPSAPPKFREPGSGATLPVLAPEAKSGEMKIEIKVASGGQQ